MARDMIFSSESVTAGHPDKLCDQISDAAIDALLRADRLARASIECAVATGIVFLAAHCAARVSVDLPTIARGVIADAGYLEGPFNARNCSILTSLSERPIERRDIESAGSGDDDFERHVAQEQVNAFGYACDDTPELMPLPVSLAHGLARALDDLRRTSAWLSPDCKTQVSVAYAAHRPRHIHSVSLKAALAPHTHLADASDQLRALARASLSAGAGAWVDETTSIHVNTTSGDADGPAGHAGLTGRKNGIDTYGEISRQSGAALSGKDPSRVDRIGAYAARHAAKNIVGAGLAQRCEVHLAYAIGRASPISISVDTFGTGNVGDDVIADGLGELIDFRPAAIGHRFGLRSRAAQAGDAGFFRRLAVYGHFGRHDLDLPWEHLDLVDALRR